MKISSVIRDTMPPHFKNTDIIYDFLKSADDIFDEIHSVSKGLVTKVADIDHCDVRYIPAIAESLGINNLNYMGVECLDPDDDYHLEIINFLNEVTTFNAGKNFVKTSTDAKYDEDLIQDQHNASCPGSNADPTGNLPKHTAEAISVNPVDTSGNDPGNPISDLYCEINTVTVSTILDQTIDPGSKTLTEKGISLAHVFGIEYVKYIEGNILPSLYALFMDHLTKIIHKMKWYRKMIKETVIRYQDKGSRKAIEVMFSDYILREFSDYGKGLKGQEFPGAYPEGGYVTRTVMSTESFVDNGFKVEVVELSDPWDYFTGDPNIVHDPIGDDPEVEKFYSFYPEQQNGEEFITQQSLDAMINMFPNAYADSPFNFINDIDPSSIDDDIATGNYTGFPRFPYNAQAYENSYVEGDPWEFTTESIPHGIEIVEIGQQFMTTIKSYNMYKRRNVLIDQWESKAISTAAEIFTNPSLEEYPSSAYNYEEALRKQVNGIDANWGDFVSNTRGTAATLQNAYDQSEFDDIYHYFSFNNQSVMSYIDPEVVEAEPASELHENFRSFDAYLTQEESFGTNIASPTLANGEWGDDAATTAYIHKGKVIKNYESDIFGNRYILVSPASPEILSNPTTDNTTSNHIHTLTGGTILKKDTTDGATWEQFPVSYIPTMSAGSIFEIGMISDTIMLVSDVNASTNTKHVAFVKVDENGPVTSTTKAPILANINEDFLYGRIDASSGEFYYATRYIYQGSDYAYNLYSYNPDEHNIVPVISGLVPSVQTSNPVTVEVYPGFEASVTLVYEDSGQIYFDRLSKRYGSSSSSISTSTLPGYVEPVGAIANYTNGDLVYMYNTNENPSVINTGPELYTSFLYLNRYFKNSDIAISIPSEPSAFVYKHSPEDGTGDALLVDPGAGNKPELSFASNRVRIIDYAVNDQMVAFVTAPINGIYDYNSFNDNQTGPKLVGDYSYWADSSQFGMTGDPNNPTYQDLGLNDTHYFNSFGHFNLSTDVQVGSGGTTSKVKMMYNMANLKNQYYIDENHPDTSYYLPTTFSANTPTTRRYWRVKLNETIYFSLYDVGVDTHDPVLSTSGIGMNEGVAEWNLFNPGLAKTGLFDIKIHNFVFSPTLTSNQIQLIRKGIEESIRKSVELVKPGYTVLRKIRWINPVIGELPEYTVPGPYGIEFDDSYIQIIDKNGEEVLTVSGNDPNRFECSTIYELLVGGASLTTGLITQDDDLPISTEDGNNVIQTQNLIIE